MLHALSTVFLVLLVWLYVHIQDNVILCHNTHEKHLLEIWCNWILMKWCLLRQITCKTVDIRGKFISGNSKDIFTNIVTDNYYPPVITTLDTMPCSMSWLGPGLYIYFCLVLLSFVVVLQWFNFTKPRKHSPCNSCTCTILITDIEALTLLLKAIQ